MQLFRRNHELRRLVLHKEAGAFAAYCGNLALQAADARLPGIGVNQLVDGLRRNVQHLGRHPVLFELLRDQVLLRDMELFLMRIAAEGNHVHPVVQRLRDGAGVVRRGDEQHPAQVEGHVDIVVVKHAVLVRVQHLQQSGGRVAAEIVAHLVDLVQQNQRVRGAGLLERRDNPARHGADIGAAVADDVGLVAHAPQRDADVFAPDRLRNGVGDGGFAHAGRPDQADNLAAHVGRQLFDGHDLQNAVLDLLQAVVVAVENPAGALQVDALPAVGMPRQLQARLDIADDYAALVGAFRHLVEALAFLHQFVALQLRQARLFDALFKVIRLLAGIVALAQLVGDGAHLLAQKIFALVLVNLLLRLFVDLGLDGENLNLFLKNGRQLFQPSDRVQLLQDGLLLLVVEHDVGGDVVGHLAAVPLLNHADYDVRRDVAVVLDILLKEVLRMPDERLGPAGAPVRPGVGADQLDQQERLLARNGNDFRPIGAFGEQADALVAAADNLLDFCHDAIPENPAARRVVVRQVLLRDEENHLVFLHRGLQRLDGFFSPHVELEKHPGEYHKAPQRERREGQYILFL